MDVRIDGKSIVHDGVAEIPVANGVKYGSSYGLVHFVAGYCYGIETGRTKTSNYEATDGIKLVIPSTVGMNGRYNPGTNGFGAITTNTFDYAVKAAMCDGKGAAWTAEEQAAARERMGIGDLKNVVSATLEEESIINITLDKDGNAFDYDEVYIRLIIPKTSVNISDNITVGDLVYYVSSITNASYNINYYNIYAKRINGIGFCEYTSHTNSDNNIGQVRRSALRTNIRKFYKFGTYKPFPAGTQIIIYAR